MATLANDRIGVRAVDPLDVSRPELYRDDTWHAPFAELRERSPINYTPDSVYGAYCSVSTYKPIVHI